MNELQLGLLAIGVAVVGGVYAFNRWQEKKLKRRTEQLFQSDYQDVLMDQPADTGSEAARIEPTLGEPAPVETATPVAAEKHEAPAPSFDAAIDYIARVTLDDPATTETVKALMGKTPAIEKSVRWFGQNQETTRWEKIAEADPGLLFRELIVAIQLADRRGPLSAHEISLFCDMVQGASADLLAAAECPDVNDALAQAATLDQFCAEADILVGLNVIPGSQPAIPATKVRAMAEAAGMKLSGDGAFYCVSDEGSPLFSLCNLDPTPFSADNIKQLSTHGVTLLLDVPRVANGVRVFDQLLMLAKQMAASLGGQVVDDNRKPLTEGGAEEIRRQLKEIYANMRAAQIEPGSRLAMRLFS